jgi:hypothetical protein
MPDLKQRAARLGIPNGAVASCTDRRALETLVTGKSPPSDGGTSSATPGVAVAQTVGVPTASGWAGPVPRLPEDSSSQDQTAALALALAMVMAAENGQQPTPPRKGCCRGCNIS